MLVAAFFKSLVVGGCCFIKFIFIARYAGEPFLDHGWQLLSNVGWVVQFGVNVSQYGVRFPKGQYLPVLALKVTSRKSI